MRDQHKKGKTPERQTTVVKGTKKGAGDVASQQLRGAASKMGNAALEDKLKKPEAAQAPAKAPEPAKEPAKTEEVAKAAAPAQAQKKENPVAALVAPQTNPAQRDLLNHASSRLKALYEVQLVEKAEMKNQRAWFRDVARGKEGFHLPDPTRYHEPARLYQKAAEALCKGDVAKGARLIEQAIDAEKACLEMMPEMVKNKLSSVERSTGEAPATLSGAINTTAPAEEMALPKEMEYARKILAVTDKMEDTPPLARAKKTWVDEIEEEDEQNANKGKKTEGKSA
jgi:hypothetical protein